MRSIPHHNRFHGAISPVYPYRLLNVLSLIFIGIGIVLRVMQFASGRSLWADEAKLALNIIDRSYLELFQVLDYDQVAPIGFLLIEKFFVQLFGATEFALRLFPFLAGIASLFLIYHLAKRYLRPVAVPIAIALFALLSRQIYYTSEIKQYSSDVMIALALVSLIHVSHVSHVWQNPAMSPNQNRGGTPSYRQIFLFAGVGAIAIWLSHPATFILASIALTQIVTQLVQTLREGKPVRLAPWIPVYGAWAISFMAFYLVSLGANSSNDTLLSSWANRRAFPVAFPDLDWLFYSLKRFFWKPLDFPKPFFDMVAIAIYLVGSISLYRRRKGVLLLLTSPLIVTLVAAYLNKYPFYSRVIIFLVPFFVLMIAEGLAFLMGHPSNLSLSRQNRPRLIRSLIGLIAAGVVLYIPAVSARPYLSPPVTDEEIKPLLAYVTDHWQSGDRLYVFQKSQHQFQFYQKQFGIQESAYIVSVDPDTYVEENFTKVRRLFREDLKQLCGSERVWVLTSDIDMREQTIFMLSHLDRLGKRLDSFQSSTPAAFVYLYDLTNCKP